MKTLKVGIDNYSLYPLELDPMETLQWAKEHGAKGVSFSGLNPKDQKKINRSYLTDLSKMAEEQELYLEWGGGQHIPRDMVTWDRKDLFEHNKKVAEEAGVLGTRIVRSCSGGLMRWSDKSPATETLLNEMADTLKSQRQMLRDLNVIFTIETHFEFTTFELLKLFEMCEAEPGDYLGICLDTMNLLTMLEDPISAVKRILPWVVSTHIKDGAILLTSGGLKTFPVEMGRGIVDIKKIINLINTLERDIYLSIEDHGGEFFLPVFNPEFLSKFPDLTATEFVKLMKLAQFSEEKYSNGEISITDRKKWLGLCEERVYKDINTLNEILKTLNSPP